MRLWIALIVTSIVTCSALAETYYIRKNGDDVNTGLTPGNAFASLSHFASIAKPGDSVYIGAGEYTVNTRFRVGADIERPIRIIGDPTGSHTGDAGQVILKYNQTMLIVRVVNADHYEFHNLRFQGGQEGIRIDSSDGVVIENCTFDDARDKSISVMNNGSVTITGCDIAARKNGIHVQNGSVVVSDTSIHDLSGTALHVQNSGSSIEARRVDIRRVKRGASANNGSLSLINVLVDDTAQEGVLTKNTTTLLMVQCTINDIEKQGAKFSGTTTLYNNIFSNIGSHCTELRGGRVIASHNLMFNRRGDRSRSFNSKEFEFDPQYTNPDAGDFSLLAESRAKDIGRDTSSYTELDISGFDRPSGEGFDLGAYETSPPPVYYVRSNGSESSDGRTPNTAFSTIQHAVNQCTQAGSTVYVGPGVYSESVQVGFGDGSNAISGSEPLPIRVIADVQGAETNEDPGEVVLDGQSVRSIGIEFRSVDHWELHGFTIKGQTGYAIKGEAVGLKIAQSTLHVPQLHGVHLKSSGDVEVSDCRFVRTLDSGSVIWVQPTNRSQPTTVTVTRNDASLRGVLYRASGLERGDGHGPSTTPGPGTSYGIFVTAASGPSIGDVEISNNIISDCDVGVYTDLNVSNNHQLRVMNNTITGSCYSLYVRPRGTRFLMTNNIVSSCYYGAVVPDGQDTSGSVYAHMEHDIEFNMARFGRSFEFDLITGDPGFADAENGDFSLSRRSPAVDSGYARYAPGVDINEVSRPADGNNDDVAAYNIGATETVVDGTSRVRVVQWRELGGAE